MSAFFAHSQYMPCTECGSSVAAAERDEHVCDRERVLDYRMLQLREEIAGFEDAVWRYLDSAYGRFEQWLAARQRHAPS